MRDSFKTTLTTISLTDTHVDIHDDDIINIIKKILKIIKLSILNVWLCKMKRIQNI